MRRLWKTGTRLERFFIILHLLLVLSSVALCGLFFLGVPWHIANTFVWCLFSPVFFTRARIYWRTDRDRAGMDIISGIIAGVASLIGLLAFLMTI